LQRKDIPQIYLRKEEGRHEFNNNPIHSIHQASAEVISLGNGLNRRIHKFPWLEVKSEAYAQSQVSSPCYLSRTNHLPVSKGKI
jgi:hypothetical protein